MPPAKYPFPAPPAGFELNMYVGLPKNEGERYRWWLNFHVNVWDFATNSWDYFWWETNKTKLGCRITRESLQVGIRKKRWYWQFFRWSNF